jgi:NAD(P)-dependent dehydrogenase (short-subunit alcohol dehydrogenase family)
MDLELTGKRAVVTGGNRGIGLAVARALAAEGCDVALVARDKAALDAARDVVAAASGRTVLALPCDTGDDESVAAMAAAVTEELGGADILVNAAAKANTGAVVGIDGFDADEFGEQVNVKVLGYLRCIRAFVPHMRDAGWGRIVNVSGLAARSSGAITGTVRNVAVAAMTKNLADELGKHGKPRRAGRTRRGHRRGNRAATRDHGLHRAARHSRRGRERRHVPRLAAQRGGQRRRDRRRRRRGRPGVLLELRGPGPGGPAYRAGPPGPGTPARMLALFWGHSLR